MPKTKSTTQLADVLVSKKLITTAQAKEISLEADKKQLPFAEVLASRGLVSQEDLLKAKAEIYNIPAIDLVNRTIPPEVIKLIPREIAETYKMVAYEATGKEISVALVNPTNYKAIEAIEFIAREKNLHVKYFVASPEGLVDALRQYGSLKVEVKEALTQVEDNLQSKDKSKKSTVVSDESEGKFEEIMKTAPVAKMVSVILRHAVEGGASDIHIEPTDDETRVRFRIDGILHTSIVLPRYIHAAIISRVKVLANLKIDETRVPQDGRIRVAVDGRPIDLRVSTMPLLNSEKVVMRILDTESGVLTLEDLGFTGRNLELLRDSLTKTQGMLLVTGPTGSGKSTTLYSALNILNEEGVNIITLEDPIEYHLKGVNQSQINTEVGYTFANGLRSILRQDPNIILVGEIRDTETAELAIHASLTGHVVLSTLHTNDAIGAIPRMIDMHVEPFLIASTVNLVIAQRLVRRICSFCSEKIELPSNVVDDIKKDLKDVPADVKDFVNNQKWSTKKAVGCNRCNFTGYRGRVVIAEALDNTPELQELIVTGYNMMKVQEEFKRQGLLNMKQDGLLKVIKGITTLEEVLTETKS